MSSRNRYLVVMDVPGIKDYVFGTNRLVEIRGASALLDHLNRVVTPKFLEDKLGKPNVECIISNGGAGQFIIEADENEVEGALADLRGYFFQQSKGELRLILGISQLSATDYSEALEQANLKLKEEKEGNPIPLAASLHTGYVCECASCSGMASQFVTEAEGTQRPLCSVCAEKASSGRKRGLWSGLSEYLKTKGKDPDEIDAARPQSFEEIGDCCHAKKGYTALVYADGNGLGRLTRQIKNKSDFEFLSNTVDQAIRESCHEAIHESCSFTDKLPVDILLLGGDDLLVYLSAETAFPFAVGVAQKFARKTEERFSNHTFFADLLKGKGLTISSGIAYGKSYTPFSILLNQAEELLQSAKKAGSLDPRAGEFFSPSYIDYHFASYFNQVRVDACRKNHLQIYGQELLLLYQKPYSLEDAQALLDHARSLVAEGIPGTRLKRFGYAPSLGKVNATLECLKLYTRTRKEHRLAIWEALDRFGCAGGSMPWKKQDSHYTTALIDLMELTEFIT